MRQEQGENIMRKVSTYLCIMTVFIFSFFWFSMDAQAVSYPNLTLEFEEADQSVIVAGVPAYDSTGATRYEIQGNLKYAGSRRFLLGNSCCEICN